MQGTYVAQKSGYQLEIITQGIHDIGEESTVNYYKLVQVCPLTSQGRPLRFNMSYERGQPILLVSQDAKIPAREWEWRTLVSTLQQTLAEAGYQRQNPVELKAMAKIVDFGEGDNQPPPDFDKVAVLQKDENGNYQIQEESLKDEMEPGQEFFERAAWTDSITIVQKTADTNYRFNRNRPKQDWIAAAELSPCALPPKD